MVQVMVNSFDLYTGRNRNKWINECVPRTTIIDQLVLVYTSLSCALSSSANWQTSSASFLLLMDKCKK